MNLHLNGAAQIILALLLGVAAVLKALAIFLPVWRNRASQEPGRAHIAANDVPDAAAHPRLTGRRRVSVGERSKAAS